MNDSWIIRRGLSRNDLLLTPDNPALTREFLREFSIGNLGALKMRKWEFPLGEIPKSDLIRVVTGFKPRDLKT